MLDNVKSLWKQIKQMATRVLISKYCLDDFKTICQDYTQEYNKIDFLTLTDGLSSNMKYMLCVCYVQFFYMYRRTISQYEIYVVFLFCSGPSFFATFTSTPAKGLCQLLLHCCFTAAYPSFPLHFDFIH